MPVQSAVRLIVCVQHRALAQRTDLDLVAHGGRWHRHHQGTELAADVEQHRALPGPGVLHLRRGSVSLGAHETAAVPGAVWKPPPGSPRNGNVSVVPPLVSVVPSVSTPAAPSGVNVGSTSGSVRPATARSSIATTSSPTRRPFGKPARSPPSTPRLFGLAAGGIARFSRSMSDC